MGKVRLLYISAHSILEYDELKLFHDMGIQVFSHGRYVDPQDAEGDNKRPLLDIPFYPELFPFAKACAKESLAPELIEWADVIVFMGSAVWIAANWEQMRGKRVIWRSIGQSTTDTERQLASMPGLIKVRYSPTERTLEDYAGEDALIRFYKDEDEFAGWTGETPQVISVGQMVKPRDRYCGLTWYEQATEGLRRMMIGPHNEDIETMPSALLSYDDLKAALRDNRAFFYSGTYPAPYTLGFIEAWIMGIPVVAIGQGLRDRHFHGSPGLYEIPTLLDHAVTGYWSDELDELHIYCEALLQDHALAREIGNAGREAAIPIFGKEAAKAAWREVLS